MFPGDFLVFPGDFSVSLGRMSHKIHSIWPAPQLLNPGGLTDPLPLRLAVSPEDSGVSWLLDLAGACQLALQVGWNGDLDLALSVIAHGCYRGSATQMPGAEQSNPKQVYSLFVGTGGVVEIQSDRIVVRYDQRAHNRTSAQRRWIGTAR